MNLKEDIDEKIKKSKDRIEDINHDLEIQRDKLDDDRLDQEDKDYINLEIKELQLELQKEKMYLKDLQKDKEKEKNNMKESLNSIKVEKLIQTKLEKENKIYDFEIEEINKLTKGIYEVSGQGVNKRGDLVLVSCDILENDGFYEIDVVDVIVLD